MATVNEEVENIELCQPTSSTQAQSVSLIKENIVIKTKILKFPGFGLLLALMASVCFSIASLTIKLLPTLHPLSILFGRSLMQLFIFIPVCVYNKHSCLGVKGERLFLFGRIIFGTTAISGLYYAVRLLPLADASTIVFSSPAFVGIFACLLLKEPCGIFDAGTVVLVIIGVVLISKPSLIFGGVLSENQLEGTLAALTSTVTQGLVYVCLRKLKKTPTSVTIVTFSIFVALVCMVVLVMLQDISVPKCGVEAALFVACGLFSASGQFFITTAAKIEKAGPLSVVRTMDILMAFLFQISFLGVYPMWNSIVGAIIICLTVLALGLRRWYKEKPDIFSCGHQASIAA